MNKHEQRELDRTRRIFRHDFRVSARGQKILSDKVEVALQWCERFFVVNDNGVSVTTANHKDVEEGQTIDELLSNFRFSTGPAYKTWWPESKGAGAKGSYLYGATPAIKDREAGVQVGDATNAARTSHVSAQNVAASSASQNTLNPNRSEELSMLIQASDKFWSRADRTDPNTHPLNKGVVEWLMRKGFTKRKADTAASILRPQWAVSGRRADE